MVWLAAFFPLSPFLYAFAFCHPRGDDFDAATRAMFLFDLPGGIYEIGREWLTWSGRYSYHFLAVFLGKAATSPPAYALACLAPPVLLAFAFYLCGRLAGARPGRAALLALLAALAIFCCHGNLPDFYLLTDALTIGLQAATFCLFLAALLALDAEPLDSRRQWQAIAAAGFAIGVYEHSALAVFWTAACAVLLKMRARQRQAEPRGGKTGAWRPRTWPFVRVWIWVCGFCLFSLGAPGNFRRGVTRGVDWPQRLEQLARAPEDLVSLLASFLQSAWLPAIFCLTFILVAWRDSVVPRPSSKTCQFFPLIICAYLAFAISAICMHALSDVPFAASPKLTASLEFYAAIALAIIFVPIWSYLIPPVACFWRALPIIAAFLLFMILTPNFQRTTRNAVNGQIALFAEFMENRAKYITAIDRAGYPKLPPFGIVGEMIHPGARSVATGQNEPQAVVCAAPSVFPIHMGAGLGSDPAAWPNRWAAWLYGLGAIKALPPNGEMAISLVLRGEGVEYQVPPELEALGRIWRVSAPGGPNMTFATDWLIVSAAPPKLYLLRPNPPMEARLAPLWLQCRMLENLLAKSKAAPFWAALAASPLVFDPETHEYGNMRALPLGMARSAKNPWPQPVFASLDGLVYYQLRPFCQ